MHSLKFNFARIAFACLLLTVGFASTASAVQSQFQILLNLDNNVSTGCDVPTLTGTFPGVEQILITTVNTTGSSAAVTAVETRTCTNPATDTFGPPTAITPPPGAPSLPSPGWPVGVSNGTGGTSVIETFYPFSAGPPPGPSPIIRLGVLGFNSSDVLVDELLKTQPGPGNGPPILMQIQGVTVGEIPTLSEWGLILLALLLAGMAVALMKRRTRAAFLVALLLLAGAGIAWAAACDLNGTTTAEWIPSTLLATEPVSDAPAGADIRAFYGCRDAGLNGICFRIDAQLLYNQPPVVTTTAGSTAFTEDGGPVVVDAGVTVTDDGPTLASATVTITNPQDGAAETLAATSCAGLTVTPGLNNLSITGVQPLATYQTCLQSVTFNNSSQNPGTTTRVISFVANDGTASSAPANKMVTVGPGNDAPVVTTTAGSTTFTEDGGPVVVDVGVTVTDVDNANLASATVTITNPLDGAAEVLAATSCGVLTVTPGLNTLSITGSATLAAYQTCLQSVTYDNTVQSPSTTPRVISFVASDGTASSAPANKTVMVAPSPDAPVLAGTGTVTFTEDGGPITVAPAITVTDPDDANLASATVTIANPLDGAAEVLAATSCGGLTVTPGVNSLSITGSATLAVYQTCLQSVTYDNTDQDPDTTPRSVNFVANDGTSNSNTAVATVNITPSPDAPVVTTTAGATSFTEAGGPVVVDAGVTVTDVDNANLASATVTITNPQDGASEVLGATACGGLTVTPGINTLSITGSATLAVYQTCLQSVTYDNSSSNPTTSPDRVISFVANDGTLSSAAANKTVTLAAVANAPVVTTTAGATAFTEDGGAVVVDAGVTVTDADSANLASATVTITNPQDGVAEVLGATVCGGLTVTPGLNSLSITGSATLAVYQTCLQSVTYDNSSQNPTTTPDRVISFVANDGTSSSAPAFKTVTVAAVADAPVVTTTGGSTAFTEDGGPVVVDAGVTVTDADSANLASATVTITNPQDGVAEVLGVTACGGLTVTPGVNSLSITGSQAPATYQTCLQSVTYNNTDQDPDTTPRIISFVANDGALSSAPAMKTVTVASVPDAPVVTTTGGATAFTEDGGAVLVDAGVTVTDVDSANLASATVTITNPQDGASEVLGATVCGGLTVTPGLNTLSITGSATLAVYQTCLQSVTYNNSSQNPTSAPARMISFVANDGALSSAPAIKMVTVAAVADAPVVTTTAGSTAFTEDGGAVVVDAGVTVTDIDSANLASATVTITNPQDGASEVLGATACGGLTVTPGPNSLSLTGSATLAAYQTCLQSVTYNNSSQNPATAPDRVISFVANDGVLSSAPANKTVTVAAAPDAPVVTTSAGTTSFTEDNGAVVVDAAVTVTDADSANLASATVTITNPQDGAAEILGATVCGGLTLTPGLNTLSITGSATLAAYQTCLQSVTYNNSDQDPGTTPRVISFVANDGAASSAPALKTVTVASVPDAPVVVTTGGITSFTEDGGAVVVDAGVTVTDADSANLASATVTIANPADGAMEVLGATACGGLTVTPGLNSLSVTGSATLAAYQTCLQSVTYNNSSQNPGTVNRMINFVVNDGGLSSTPATKLVSVTAVPDPPSCTVNPVTYATAGNTQLHVAGATLPGVASVSDSQSLLTKGAPTDPDSPGPFTVIPASGNTGGGDWVINADGSFTFVPNPGFTGTATRTFQVSDNGAPAAIGTCTVNVNVTDVVWYVRDVVDANNAAGGDGRSNNAFEALTSAQSPVSGVGHYIYVFEGNTATTPHVGGIALADGQKLWGQGIDLDLPSFPNLVTATNKARVRATAASINSVNVPATSGNRLNVEIRGLDLEATGVTSNAIDVTSSGANQVGVTISDNNIRGATAEGIDLNSGSTGVFSATVQTNTVTAAGNGIDARVSAAGTATVTAVSNMITSTAGNAFDARTLAGATALRVAFDSSNVGAAGNGIVIDGSAAGTTTITNFLNNTVHQSTVGTGVSITSATFDAVAGGAINTVDGGTTSVGISGDGVGASGMVLTNVQGDLHFSTNLNIFAENGTGLFVSGTGGGMQFRVASGSAPAAVGIIEATGGPAVDVSAAGLDLRLTSLKSTNTPSRGVSLTNVADGATNAVFSAGSGSTITTTAGATGPIFNVSGGNADISYAGTITNTSASARAVSLTTWSGDDPTDDITLSGAIDENGAGILVNGNGGGRPITFSGGMDIDTTTGEGFAATSNTNTLGLHITGTNTIDSVSATALRITSTTIGSSNLNFQQISSGNNTAAADPASGIVLNTTGTLGRLIITGTGASGQGGNGTGGLIQNTTSHGISLTDTMNPSFTNMSVQSTAGSGVNGTLVAGFTFDNGTINNSGTGGAADDSNISFNDSSSSANVSGTVTVTDSVLTNSRFHGIDIQHYNGTIAHADIENNVFTSAASIATSLGSAIRLDAYGTAAIVGNVSRATINNNVITNFPTGAGIHAFGGNSGGSGPAGTFGVAGSGTDVIAITNNQMNGGSLGVGNQPDRFFTGGVNGSGQGNFNISGNGTVANPITNIDGVVIELNQFGTGSMTATVNNNRIVANNAVGSAGINVGCDADATAALDNAVVSTTISGNNVSDTDGPGIFAIARGSDCSLTARILNNTVAAPDTTTAARAGIRVDSGSATGDTTLCLEISGNTTAGSTNTATSTTSPGINLRKQGTSTTVNIFGIEGLSPSPTGTPNVENHVNSLNTSTSGTFGVNGTALLSATSGFTSCVAP